VQRSYSVGDTVWVRNFSQGPTWLAGEVVQHNGQCSLNIKLADGHCVLRHLDHVRQKVGSTIPVTENLPAEVDDPLMDLTSPNIPPEPPREQQPLPQPVSAPRRSARHRRPPNRLTY